ncbi:hypothetical protein SUGI_1034970 [Cryptomeria japonica]|nr:hypothetical protein SUGI_1034970 [Cryptomeria japonica]
MLIWAKAYLDLVLVPSGLLFLGVYHLYLLYRILKYPHSTAIGFENDKKKIWVQKMMEDIPRNTDIALRVISRNISAATYLAGLSITLSSLIGTIVGSSTTSSQSKTLYIHVSFLISTPGSSVPAHYVEDAVIRGSNFWSLGIRAYYFAFPLLLWVFGPIPMFSCSLGMVCFLYFLDSKDNPIPPLGLKEKKTGLDAETKRGKQRGQVIESSYGRSTLASSMVTQMESPQLQME